MQVKEAVEVYELTINNLSKETQIWYLNKLRAFMQWCEAEQLELENITRAYVKRYLSILQNKINPRTKKPLTSNILHGYAG